MINKYYNGTIRRKSKCAENQKSYTLFYKSLEILGIEKPVVEYRFDKVRRWRFDFCFVQAKLALEIEGGIWINGRHNRGSGFVKDMEKYNTATILGYRLLRVTPEQMQNGVAVGLVKQYFKGGNGR